MKTYSPASPAYRRIVQEAARGAIRVWLDGLDCSCMYLFTVDDVECALEHFTGHWGFAEGARWRWGRVDAGDPDDDDSGENVLLDVALSRVPGRSRAGRRHRAKFPPYADRDLTQAEIEAAACTRAEENLRGLILHKVS